MASNSVRGSVEIELGGVKRTVKFDLNALCELETHFDKPSHLIFDTERGIGLREIRDTLWIGLQRFHKGVELDHVGNWLQAAAEEGRIEEVSTQLGKAMSFALNGLGGEEEPSGNPEPPQTGAATEDSTSQDSSNKPAESE